LDQGEKEQDYPMAWDEIAAAKYTPWSKALAVDKLKATSTERVKANSGFTLLNDAAKRLKKQKDETVVSLNYDKFMAEQKKYKEEAKKMDALDKEIEGVEVLTLKTDIVPESDTVKVAKNKEWYKAIKKDIYLHETVNIISEMQ
jgi:carboxyl-terminal processing protease